MNKISISQDTKKSKRKSSFAPEEERISVRWGIPFLEEGFTTIPNLILDNMAALGLNPWECLLVIHLARYKYESDNGQACPSLRTLAAKMGCSVRWVWTLIQNLKAKKLIKVTRRKGTTSVYDLSPLAKACLKLAHPDYERPPRKTKGGLVEAIGLDRPELKPLKREVSLNEGGSPPFQARVGGGHPIESDHIGETPAHMCKTLPEEENITSEGVWNICAKPPEGVWNTCAKPPLHICSIEEEEEEEIRIKEEEEIAEKLEELGVFPEQAREIAKKMAEAGLSAEEAEEIFLRTLESVQDGKPRKEGEVVAIAVHRLRKGQWDGGERGRRALRKAQSLALNIPQPPPQPSPKEEGGLEALWKKALAELEGKMPKATFSAHFPQTHLLELQDGKAIIAVSDPTAKAWLEEKFAHLVHKVLAAVLGKEIEVNFVCHGGV